MGSFVWAWLWGGFYSSRGKLPCSNSYKVPMTVPGGCGALGVPSPSTAAGGWAQSYALCQKLQVLWIHDSKGLSCLEHSFPYQSFPSSGWLWAGILQAPPCLLVLTSFFFLSVPWTLKGMIQMSPLGLSLQRSLTLSSLASQEPVHAGASAHCKMKLCWWRLKATHICGHSIYIKKAVWWAKCAHSVKQQKLILHLGPITSQPKPLCRFREPGMNLSHAAGITSWHKIAGPLYQSWRYCSRGLILSARSLLLLAGFTARCDY